MASISLFLSSSIITSLLFSLSMATPLPNQNQTAPFIRSSCSHTLYRGLCYASLSPFADQIGNDSVLIARIAMNVTLSRLKPLSVRIESLPTRSTFAPSYSVSRMGGSLKDCTGLINDAKDLVRKSEKEVAGLEQNVGPEVMWRISNAQTWLSAALTDEDTCAEELDEGSSVSGEEVEFVYKKLDRAKKFTSNALALVNCLG